VPGQKLPNQRLEWTAEKRGRSTASCWADKLGSIVCHSKPKLISAAEDTEEAGVEHEGGHRQSFAVAARIDSRFLKIVSRSAGPAPLPVQTARSVHHHPAVVPAAAPARQSSGTTDRRDRAALPRRSLQASEETCGLTPQMRRAAASIPSNIAEGCGRDGDAELARFCTVARGSASELEYQILLLISCPET
jgi:hypothetical protein